ncbi:MAG: 16S rRNA (cytosine(1402)-N(4))-methyltransferase RsmH [Desulfobacteraceae bacterium]|nr:16S rRNA (cytosine(1402)-N(4))-methyltransferase RsmH [Desulfobacteraceae bacterium]
MIFTHTSVMPREIRQYLDLKPGDTCVDCTLGGSGHALTSLKAVLPGGRLIGTDQDRDAIENAHKVFEPYASNVHIYHDNFSKVPRILESMEIEGVDGILLDLGLSLHQLRQGKRGFSFKGDEPLDMRMDLRADRTAADLVNQLDEKELVDIFFKYGEERMSRKIARAVVKARSAAPITRNRELAEIVRDAMPAKLVHQQKIHPATRVFQALRIAVNRELERLERFMEAVPDMLNPGGRICVISFHSLEDRIVKQQIRAFEQGCTCPRDFPQCVCGFTPRLKAVSKKAIMPTREETEANPMARSARLRVAEKV